MRRLVASAFLLAAVSVTAPAQMVVSAHSGTLHYFEGDVSIDGVPIKFQPAHFTEIKEQSVLRTARGRAEVLLTPGVFLRVGENSAIRMLDNRLASTRIEIVSGGATLECDAATGASDKYKMAPVSVLFKSYEIAPVKDGLIEITSDPAQVRVFKGEAKVQAGDSRVTVKDGHEVFLTAALATEKFDEKGAADDNYIWARDRSAVVSAANLSSARTLASNSLYGGSMYGGSGWGGSLWNASPVSTMWGGGWYFNPFFGMYTYMPVDGFAFSPFGYGFYSPYVVNSIYAPGGGYWYGGGGARMGAVAGRPITGSHSVIGRPVNGPGGVSRGLAVNNAALRPVSPSASANVISSRAAAVAAANRSGGFSRGEPMNSGGFGGAMAGGGGGAIAARPAASMGGAAGGARAGGSGGGVRGR